MDTAPPRPKCASCHVKPAQRQWWMNVQDSAPTPTSGMRYFCTKRCLIKCMDAVGFAGFGPPVKW